MPLVLLLTVQLAVASASTVDRLVPVAPTESLHVTVTGRGAPVVFVPGLVGSAFAFRKVIALLPPDRFAAIVIEPLGFGHSSRPRQASYSLTAQADRLARALDSLGVTDAIIVAHSVGASIGLRLAYRHPERVAALLSLDGGPTESAATAGFKRALRFVPLIKWAGGMSRIRREMRKGLVAASADSGWVTDEVIEAYTAGIAADLDGTLRAYLRIGKAREPERVRDHLADVAAPVRLLRGDASHGDGVTADEVALLARVLPSFRLDTVAGSGHHIHEERPDAVARAIAELHGRRMGPAVALVSPLTPTR